MELQKTLEITVDGADSGLLEELQQSLTEHGITCSTESRASAKPTMGVIEFIEVFLGSTAVVTAVKLIPPILEARRSRVRVTVIHKDKDCVRKVVLDGSNITTETINKFLAEAENLADRDSD